MDANEVVSDWLAPYRGGSTEPWAVSVLQALIRLKKPMNLLELGTFEGRTTRAMAEVMPKLSRLWTVDVETRHDPFEDRRIIPHEMDAIEFLTHHAPRRSVDFAFVDDDHTLAHVTREVELLLDGVMAERGLIVLHDVIGPFGLDAVVREFGGFVIELPLLHAGGGLGVIEV